MSQEVQKDFMPDTRIMEFQNFLMPFRPPESPDLQRENETIGRVTLSEEESKIEQSRQEIDLLLDNGQYQDAQIHLAELMTQMNSEVADNLRSQGVLHTLQGNIDYVQQDYGAAVHSYERALECYKKAGDNNNIYTSAQTLTQLYPQAEEQSKDPVDITYRHKIHQSLLTEYIYENGQQVDYEAVCVEQGGMGFTKKQPIGTHNLRQCIAIVACDPTSGNTGLAHFDYYTDPASLKKDFFEKFDKRLKLDIYILGGKISDPSHAQQVRGFLSTDVDPQAVLRQVQEKFVASSPEARSVSNICQVFTQLNILQKEGFRFCVKEIALMDEITSTNFTFYPENHLLKSNCFPGYGLEEGCPYRDRWLKCAVDPINQNGRMNPETKKFPLFTSYDGWSANANEPCIIINLGNKELSPTLRHIGIGRRAPYTKERIVYQVDRAVEENASYQFGYTESFKSTIKEANCALALDLNQQLGALATMLNQYMRSESATPYTKDQLVPIVESIHLGKSGPLYHTKCVEDANIFKDPIQNVILKLSQHSSKVGGSSNYEYSTKAYQPQSPPFPSVPPSSPAKSP